MAKRSCKLLVASTGCLSASKVPLLLKSLLERSHEESNYTFETHLLVTEAAKYFIKETDVPKEVAVYDDGLEWQWQKKDDPIMHTELTTMADMMVIAPLSANSLAKMSHGLTDNLLTCVTRAWDFKKPLIFCPGMNKTMWSHPITAKNIAILKQWGHIYVPPVIKTVKAGGDDTIIATMAEIDTILKTIVKVANLTIRSNIK